jgi:hypothetical protein
VKIEQYIDICTNAIRSNFKNRNSVVFPNMRVRQLKIQSDRRATIRGWVSELRLARNPATRDVIANKVAWRL